MFQDQTQPRWVKRPKTELDLEMEEKLVAAGMWPEVAERFVGKVHGEQVPAALDYYRALYEEVRVALLEGRKEKGRIDNKLTPGQINGRVTRALQIMFGGFLDENGRPREGNGLYFAYDLFDMLDMPIPKHVQGGFWWFLRGVFYLANRHLPPLTLQD